jgi:hypothetical protein
VDNYTNLVYTSDGGSTWGTTFSETEYNPSIGLN